MGDENELDFLVVKSCDKYRDRVAVIYDDGVAQTRITYNEIKLMSDCISEFIKPLKISNSVVGYYGNANKIFISLFISILKQSAAFVTLTDENNENLIESIGIKWIFTDQNIDKVEKRLGRDVVKHETLDLAHGELIIYEIKSVNNCQKSKLKCAYVIQTSGTTGQSKIVRVPHTCIVPNIIDLSRIFSLSTSDLILLNAPLTFDPSIVEIFTSLFSGSTLLIIPEMIKINPEKFLEYVTERHKITVLMATPSTIKRLGNENISSKLFHESTSLRIMCFGGEICPSVTILRQWIADGNKTAFYNIYGITEVSSWATLHRITKNDLSDDNNAIPLGKALSFTRLDIRDNNGQIIEYGEGMLYVGGDRVCFVDDEDDSILGKVFRETGDVVRRDRNGQMYFVCRKDKQVKRYGKKVSLSAIEDVASAFDSVETSCALFDAETQNIYLFVVPTIATNFDDFRRNFNRFSALQSHARPNRILRLSSLPLTSHGKIDTDKLLQLARNRHYVRPQSYRNYIDQQWKRLLNVSEIKDDDNFVSLGGNSIQIIEFADNFCSITDHPLPRLVELLLNSNFACICDYVIDTAEDKSENNTLNSNNTQSLTQNVQIVERNENLLSSRRGAQVTMNLTQNAIAKPHWKYDLNKCIDASALIVSSKANSIAKVFVGSHSHEFAAINLETGKALWVTQLGGRIESSACISLCGKFVMVGCYDSFVYCLYERNGEINWKFQTGSQIKCSPVVDPVSGNLFIGSHDHHIYCLQVVSGDCIWKSLLSPSSIFASPCLSVQPYALYVGTLDGTLCCLDPTKGSISWKINLEKPIFASPTVSGDKLFVATVKGELHCFTHLGNQIWSCVTEGPIFSTPVIFEEKFVLFGCHDKKLYCVFLETGNVCWTLNMDSPIYATPCLIRNSCAESQHSHVGVIGCTSGRVTLFSIENGTQISSFALPGQIFSSPIMLNDKLVIGCRDNFVYCLAF